MGHNNQFEENNAKLSIDMQGVLKTKDYLVWTISRKQDNFTSSLKKNWKTGLVSFYFNPIVHQHIP